MAREPRIECYVEDTNQDTIDLTGDATVLVRHKSHALASFRATAYDGASINLDTLVIRNGSQTGYAYTHTFKNVESEKFTFSAEDSNGLVGRQGFVADMIPYVELTCNLECEVETDGTVNVVCSGECFNGQFGKADNTLTLKARYAKEGEAFGGWQTLYPQRSGNAYIARLMLIGFGDYKTKYNVEVYAQDKLSTVVETAYGVKSMPIFHWGGDDFVFEVPVTFKKGFTGGSSDSGSSGSSGSNSGSGSGSGSGSSGDSNVVFGTWVPSLYSSAIRSYTTQQGWYTKNGNVVTLGFYVKASCYSGYSNTSVEIYSLPYSPKYSASGGGICSGVNVPAGYVFQCFVAEAGLYTITTRTQSVDTSGVHNLVTSASGCGYRDGSGEITLSGTITYITDDTGGDNIEIIG